MSCTYSQFLGIDTETMDKYMQRAEDAFDAAREFAIKHEEGVLNNSGDSLESLSTDDFADYVADRFREHLQHYDGDETITNLGISAAFDEFYWAADNSPLLNLIDCNEISTYVNGWDSHIHINGREIFCGDDITDVLTEAYQNALKSVYVKYANEKYAENPDFIQFVEEVASDSVDAMYNVELWDDLTQATIAIEDYSAIERGECPDLQETFDKDLKECYAEFAEKSEHE